MIKINNIEFSIDDVKTTCEKFFVSKQENKREGISLCIDFSIHDYFGNKNTLFLETTYFIEDLKKMNLNEEIDFSKYITDILYEENGVWNSFITGKYNSKLIKLDMNQYKIILDCYDENFDLSLEEIIDLNISIE